MTLAPSTSASAARLEQISVDRIERNPDNPRILFRQQEMDELLDSIKRWGIQVPITVYEKGAKYVLIDGERRWRCCLKLNLRSVPALVEQRPDRLTNMLLMFNIHGLREQWDLLTIALKLRDVIELVAQRDKGPPSEKRLSEETGLKIAVIRRARYLLGLPEKYRDMILKELTKPKSEQVFTEDFFIEMERALTTVERAMPDVIPNRDAVRSVLLKKFREGVIDNRVHFRKVAKIARADRVKADTKRAQHALGRLFVENRYSINQAFEDSVSTAYEERDVTTRVNRLADQLRGLEPEAVDDVLEAALRELLHEAQRLLRQR